MLPAFIGLIILKYLVLGLGFTDLIAIVVVLVIFLVPIVFNMAFGGGDLRFGAFCALFLGLNAVGYFILLSGLIHLVILTILKKKSFGFAPAMGIAALFSYFIGQM